MAKSEKSCISCTLADSQQVTRFFLHPNLHLRCRKHEKAMPSKVHVKYFRSHAIGAVIGIASLVVGIASIVVGITGTVIGITGTVIDRHAACTLSPSALYCLYQQYGQNLVL